MPTKRRKSEDFVAAATQIIAGLLLQNYVTDKERLDLGVKFMNLATGIETVLENRGNTYQRYYSESTSNELVISLPNDVERQENTHIFDRYKHCGCYWKYCYLLC